MTTLFNLFCPFFFGFSLFGSVVMMTLFTLSLLLMLTLNESASLKAFLSRALFPGVKSEALYLFTVFLILGGLNLVSLAVYSFPVTTSLSFNLSFALSFWLVSVFLILLKPGAVSVVLPSNSPWYLVPFLSLVELVSTLVRPFTLCFRLLANMSAGHILLSLICKLPSGAWLFGVFFGLLELMVSIVQSFVFVMLVNVYLDEGYHHFLFSSLNLTLKKLSFKSESLKESRFAFFWWFF